MNRRLPEEPVDAAGVPRPGQHLQPPRKLREGNSGLQPGHRAGRWIRGRLLRPWILFLRSGALRAGPIRLVPGHRAKPPRRTLLRPAVPGLPVRGRNGIGGIGPRDVGLAPGPGVCVGRWIVQRTNGSTSSVNRAICSIWRGEANLTMK